MSEELKLQVAALAKRIDSFEKEHKQFHSSRRGVEGPRGLEGKPGIPGPPADSQQVATIAAEIVKKAFRFDTQISRFEELLKSFEAEIAAVKATLQFSVITELKASGVIDAEGNAILKEGPAGKDSQVPGPKGDPGSVGKDGESIVGPAGRDAKISVGTVTTGEKASVTLREESGVQILDIVLPRGEKGDTGATGMSIVGPKGDSIEGPQGIPGKGLDRDAAVQLILDMKRRGSI